MTPASDSLRKAYAAWELANRNGDPSEASLWQAYVEQVSKAMDRVALDKAA